MLDTADAFGEEVERCAARLYDFPAGCKAWSFGVLFDRPPEWYAFVDEHRDIAAHLVQWAADPAGELTPAGRYVVNVVGRAKRDVAEHIEAKNRKRHGR